MSRFGVARCAAGGYEASAGTSDWLWPDERRSGQPPCFTDLAAAGLTGGAPRCEMFTVGVIEVVAMLAQLASGAFNHFEVAEVRVTSVVNDTDPAVPAAWREVVQRCAANDGVFAVLQRSTADMDDLFPADVDAVVHKCPTIYADVVSGPHAVPFLYLELQCAVDPETGWSATPLGYPAEQLNKVESTERAAAECELWSRTQPLLGVRGYDPLGWAEQPGLFVNDA